MPDMDGMDVLHKVREWSCVPIIIVSARDQDKEKVTALDDGTDLCAVWNAYKIMCIFFMKMWSRYVNCINQCRMHVKIKLWS